MGSVATVFINTIASQLLKTLDNIVDDKTDGYEAKSQISDIYEVGEMNKAYSDELEMAGPGFAAEVPEAVEVGTGNMTEGVFTRYAARKYGLMMRITEEAQDDARYPESVDLARRLKRALWKTVAVDGALPLARGFSTSFPLADGQPLWSASHTLPNGGTYSNLLATPMSPGRVAIAQIKVMASTMVGHDGVREGYELTKVLCPMDLLPAWDVLMGSAKEPAAGEFNAINIVKKYVDEVVGVLMWTNTSTSWAVKTDADHGLKWKWRKRPYSSSEVKNAQGVIDYIIKGRWARGCTNYRSTIGVNA